MREKFLYRGAALLVVCAIFSCKERKALTSDAVETKKHHRSSDDVARPGGSFQAQTLAILKRKRLTDEEATKVYNRLDQTTSESFAETRQLILDSDLSSYLKYRLLSRALYGLAQSGAYDEALSYAKEEANPSNRTTLLAGTFGGNRGPVDKMLQDFASLSDLEKQGASGGIATSLASREILNVDEFATSAGLDSHLRQALSSGLESYAEADLSRLPKVKEICEMLLAGNPKNSGVYEKALEFLASQHSELVLQELKGLGVTQSPQRDNLLITLSQRDPASTAKILIDLKDSKGLATSIGNWAKIDPLQARTWLNENRDQLPTGAWDASVSSIARSMASQTGDFAEANKLIADIGDPSARETAKNSIRKLEGEAVAKQVAEDPQRTLQSIASGSSSHDASWLELGITKWMQKDSPAAQAWYEQNYSNLPTSKSQYIAAAFANIAIDSGNRQIAEEWLAHIESPQLKDRIKNRLAKK